MRSPTKSALLFFTIGLVIYGLIYAAAEWLLYETGKSNPFYKIATRGERPYDWVILGASHAMTLDFGDFNDVMERATGLRILNLASPGTGPLYNRFVFEHFLLRSRTRHVLYVVDSFAFYGPAWNEDRFADPKLLSRTPFDPAIALRMFEYSVRAGVDPRGLLNYVSGFAKINNRERFEPDIWEGEKQFERVYRSSAMAVRRRIEYLYPQAPSLARAARYFAAFAVLVDRARNAGAQIVVLKMPVPDPFRRMLPGEDDFNEALARLLSARGVPFHDFSQSLDNPQYYFDTDHLNRAGLTEFFNRHLKTIFLGSAARDRHLTELAAGTVRFSNAADSALSP